MQTANTADKMDTIIKNPAPNHLYVYAHSMPNQLCERLAFYLTDWATTNRGKSLADAQTFILAWLDNNNHRFSGSERLLLFSSVKRYERGEGLTETYFFVEYKTHRQRQPDTVLMVIIYEDDAVKDEKTVALAEAIRAYLSHEERRKMLTLRGIEEMAGVTQTNLTKFLSGKRDLPDDQLKKLAEKLALIGFPYSA